MNEDRAVWAVFVMAGLLMAICALVDEMWGERRDASTSSAFNPMINFPGLPLPPPVHHYQQRRLEDEIQLHSSLPKRLPQAAVEVQADDQPAMSSPGGGTARPGPIAPTGGAQGTITGDLMRLSSSLGTASPYTPSSSESVECIGGRSQPG